MPSIKATNPPIASTCGDAAEKIPVYKLVLVYRTLFINCLVNILSHSLLPDPPAIITARSMANFSQQD